jgi:hypothetical protein
LPPSRATASKPIPALNPFAALVRERAARAKREESLPRAPDGSRQDIFAIANAALLRDPDASFEDAGSSQDASAALNQLAEGGFAAEAELVRKAGSTNEGSAWAVFAHPGEPKDDMLAEFPYEVTALLNTQRAKRIWGWLAERMSAKGICAFILTAEEFDQLPHRLCYRGGNSQRQRCRNSVFRSAGAHYLGARHQMAHRARYVSLAHA